MNLHSQSCYRTFCSAACATYAWVSLALLAAFAAACSGEDARVCQSNDDCFRGEACIAERCESAGNPGDAHGPGAVDASADSTTSTDAPDAHSPIERDASGGSSCHVGPFPGACENDDNNDNDSVTDATNFNSDSYYLDCAELPSNPWSKTVSGRFCAGETADFFMLPVMPCQTQDMTLTVTLHVRSQCLAEEYAFRFWRSNGLVREADCDLENVIDVAGHTVQCTRGEDSIAWKIRVPATNQLIGTFAFEVVGVPGAEATFDYDLTVDAQK